MFVKQLLVAVVLLLIIFPCSACGSTQAAKVSQDRDGSYVAECSSECKIVGRGVSYEVCLKVTTDGDGTILSVEDNGTRIAKYKDSDYKRAKAIFADLVGKNAETFRDVDEVSGATVSCDSILNATEKGLDAIEERIES